MICRECQMPFDAEDSEAVFDRVPYGESDVYACSGTVCPHCGSEWVEDERMCLHCEQEYARSELEDGLCAMCVEETVESLHWLWNSLSPAQQTWASEHMEWMETKE